MAGSQLDRLKNQAQIFITVKLNPKTQQGKNRLMILGLWVFLALFVLAQYAPGGSNNRHVGRSSYTITDDSDNVFEDTEEEGDGDGDGDGNLLEDNESDDEDDDEDGSGGGGDDDDDDDNDGASGNEVDMEGLKSQQQDRLKAKGAEILKFFESYRKESDIHKHFTLLSETYEDLDIIKTKVIGQTYEKKDLRVYQLGMGETGRAMLVIGLEHASEWPSPMALTYFATRMIQLYGINNDVTDLMKSLTIYLIPIVNPDGFSYSMSSKHNRHWQLNKAKSRKSKGVDLNRDWKSMTQSETLAIRDFITNRPGGIQGFVSVHCCSGNVILPERKMCANDEAFSYQTDVAKQMLSAMSDSYKYVLKQQSPATKKTGPNGFAVNWFNDEFGVKLAYTLEGRGALSQMKKKKASEKKLVDIPVSELVSVSREITKGILSLGIHIARDYDGSSDGCEGSVPVSASSHDSSEGDVYDDNEEKDFSADDDDGDSVVDDGDGDSEIDNEDESEADNEDGGEDYSAADGEDDEGTEIEAESEEDTGEVEGDTINDDDDDESMSEEKETIADTYDEAAEPAVPVRKELKLETAVSHAHKQSVSPYLPALSERELEPTLNGNGPYFFYFAYGTDMLYDVLVSSGVKSAWKVVNAKLQNYGFDYTYYSKKVWKSGVIDAFKHRHGYVWGVVYRVSKEELKQLDEHNMAYNAYSYVIPMNVSVTDKVGNVYPCRTYRVRNKMSGTEVHGKYRRFQPSRQYRNCVIKGAKQQRLPRDYIDKLRSISPLFSDKIGSTKHRNPEIGTLCDKERHR